jgi:RNA polymerase sigma factor (sigma-70 family)
MRSDAALAERFAAGDEAAFDVIYERHRPVVLAVCMGVLGAPPDAEDATQETFSALAVALRTRPPAELRPWLIRVARNASIDTTRRRRHRLLTLDGEIPEVAARPTTSGKAELAVVLDGIRELPEGQRMALLMRELGGHSYTEIAEFLETDEESVKGLIARARVGLRTYREATELSCASARATIAAEPDGRRYDKTIRRHLRTCAACRSYREALRDDAKALRAALPIQAGTVATGSLSSGLLSTAKGSLLGYGLTQAATTCAASACAVGAIGGMVFVAPVHKLGLPLVAPPAVKATPHKHHKIAKAAPARHVVIPVHTAATVYRSAAPIAAVKASSNSTSTPAHAKPVHTPAAVAHHRHHEPTVTKVHLPPVHKKATAPAHSTPAPVNVAVSTPPVTPVASSAPSTSPSSSSAPASVPATSGAGQGQGTGHVTDDPGVVRSSGNGSQSGSGSQSGNGQGSQSGGDQGSHSGDHGSHSGDGQGSHSGGDRSSPNGTGSDSRPTGGHHGGPVHVILGGSLPTASQASASAASIAPASAATPASSSPTTTTTTATTTTPSNTRPVSGGVHTPVWERDQSGLRHNGSWHPPVPVHTSAPAQPTSTANTTTTPASQTTSTSSITITIGPAQHGPAGGPTSGAPTWRTQQNGPSGSQSPHGPHWGWTGH